MKITMTKYVGVSYQIFTELSEKWLQPVRHRGLDPHEFFDVVLAGHVHLGQEKARGKGGVDRSGRRPLEVHQELDGLPVSAQTLRPIALQQVVQRVVSHV